MDLQRRRKILTEFDAATLTCSSALSNDVDEALGAIPALIDRLHDAIAAAARSGRSATNLIAAYGALEEQATHWSSRHPRPNTNRARALGRSLSTLCLGFRLFAAALGAPTMLKAQELAAQGQALIDQADEELTRLHEINESERLLGMDGFGHFGSSARAVGGDEHSLLDLDRRLQNLARPDSDVAAEGLGLNLHLIRHLMLVLLDLDECLEVTRAAEKAMGDLATICASPSWQSRHGVVTAQFSSATFNLARIDDTNDLEAVGAALNLVMQCRDGVIRHCLATLMARDFDAYERLISLGTGGVLKRAAENHPELRLDENLSKVLRHAGAHFDYDIDGDTFISRYSAGGEIRMSVDEFIDQVLGYLQTAVSLLVAITCATAAQGIDLELSRHTPERDLLAIAEMLLGFVGFVEVSVSRQSDCLQVSAKGAADDLASATAGIAAIMPQGVEQMVATVTGPDDSVRVWEASLSPFRSYLSRPSNLSRCDDLLALMRVMSTVQLDSRPFWNEDMWAGMTLLLIETATALPLRDRVSRLRALRDLARSNNQAAVADTATLVLQGIRAGVSDAGALPASPFVRAPRKN